MDEVEEQISLTLMLLNKASSDLRGHFTNSNKQFHKSSKLFLDFNKIEMIPYNQCY